MNASRSRRRETELPYYNAAKTKSSTSQYQVMAKKFRNPIALFVLCLLLLFILRDAPPFYAIRSSLCTSVSTAAYKSTAGDVLLDRFAESASEKLRSPDWQQLTTLVMVAGHAIFTGSEWSDDALDDESNWVLESFQKGQVSTFLKHIERGVQITANDSSALLMFSGGQTRVGAGPRSEGLTYWLVAEAKKWWGTPEVRNRTLPEEYARDSLENLLFSVCRFKQIVGRYPHQIKVVSFKFKDVRFIEVHRKALRFPRSRFEFHGIDPDGTEGMRSLSAAERSQAMGPFSGDPYGCNTKVLSEKKEIRNPFLRYHPYPQGCPEIAPLFQRCDRSVYAGPLPWDPRVGAEVEEENGQA